MIIVLSDTPVAGTVQRLAHWMEAISGVRTVPLIFQNYGHNAFAVSSAFGFRRDWQISLRDIVSRASLIVMHNVFREALLDLVMAERADGVPVLYQLHSPPAEPPGFDYGIVDDYEFDDVLVVSQGYGRFIPNARPVPNIIPHHSSPFNVRKQNTVLVPHMRSTTFRWSSKCLDSDIEAIRTALSYGKMLSVETVEMAFNRPVITYDEMREWLEWGRFIIDDIRTGLVHQTTMEGLLAGCGVFSAADLVAIEEYCTVNDCPDPPLIYVNGLEDLLEHLVDKSWLQQAIPEIEAKARSYAELYLGEDRAAQRYMRAIADYIPGTPTF